VKNSVWFKRFIASVILAIVPLLSAPAWGQLLQDQWYVGIGGGGAWLQPDPDQPGNNVSEAIGTGGSFTVGRDLDKNSSLQFQVAALGEAMLDDGNPVSMVASEWAI